ncbi:hypothetical protein D3C71_1911630 [compost metagenome]
MMMPSMVRKVLSLCAPMARSAMRSASPVRSRPRRQLAAGLISVWVFSTRRGSTLCLSAMISPSAISITRSAWAAICGSWVTMMMV